MSSNTIEGTRGVFERTDANVPQVRIPTPMAPAWQPPQAGGALQQMLAVAPDLGASSDPLPAEKRMELHRATHEWAATRALVFSEAGLEVEIVEGGVRVRCRSNGHEKFIARGTELTKEMLTCSGRCNIESTDPDFGMNRRG